MSDLYYVIVAIFTAIGITSFISAGVAYANKITKQRVTKADKIRAIVREELAHVGQMNHDEIADSGAVFAQFMAELNDVESRWGERMEDVDGHMGTLATAAAKQKEAISILTARMRRLEQRQTDDGQS